MSSRNLTHDEAKARRKAVDGVIDYTIELDLRGASRTTRNDEGAWESDVETFGSITTISADFTATDPTFVEIGGDVHEVTVDGDEIDIDHDGHRLTLPALTGRHEVRIDATCRYSTSGKGLTLVVDQGNGDVLCHTQGEEYGANLFFACFDQPDMKGRFTIAVTADPDWTVISNEPTTATPAAGADRWEFARTGPISTYLVAVVPGAYERIDGGTHTPSVGKPIDLGLYAGRSLADALRADADEIFEVTRQGFDFFTTKFDRPYPFTKYDQLFVPGFRFGAMENPGCVTFTDRYVFRGAVTTAQRASRVNTVLHEMAHMWFGDEVTMSWWDDLWLNESFATSTSYDAQMHATRFTSARTEFAAGMKRWAVTEDDRPTTHPIVVDVEDIVAVHQNFDGITYAKGASVLLQLMHWVGREAFYAGCATYFREFADSNTTLPDFLRHMTAASGRDLDEWANAWLKTTGIGAIRLETTAADGAITSATVQQITGEDEPDPRPHRLNIGVYEADGEARRRTLTVDVDLAGVSGKVEQLVGVSEDAILVLNDDDHAYVKTSYDERSIDLFAAHLHELDSVMARTVVWRGLWEMVRDGRLPAGRYVDMVATQAIHDTDVTSLGSLLSTASASIWRYGDPSKTAQREQLMHAAARKALAEAEAGSDLQLTWFRNVISLTPPERADELQPWLAGTDLPSGIALDPDIRWQLVGKLTRSMVADESLIDEELKRDPTAKGQVSAAAARANRPTLEAKQAAWQQLCTDPELRVEHVRALSGAFGSFRQAELLAPWVDRYFADLDTIWATRSEEDAILVAEATFPHHGASEELITRTENLIASGELQPQLRRSLAEELDTLRRTVRARELDRAS